MKIGIVGKGFVGSAVQNGFSPNTGCDAEIRVYDKNPLRSLHTLEETVNKSDFIFISVPTPARSNGHIDLTILNDVINDINEVTTNRETIFLVRSTVVPGTTSNIQQTFPKLRIVFNPEFLTERSAKFDFINQSRFVLGGSMGYTERVADLYRWRFGETTPIIKTNSSSVKSILHPFCPHKSFIFNDKSTTLKIWST